DEKKIDIKGARLAYHESALLAKSDEVLSAKSVLNKLNTMRLLATDDNTQKVNADDNYKTELQKAWRQLQALPDNLDEKAFFLIELANMAKLTPPLRLPPTSSNEQQPSCSLPLPLTQKEEQIRLLALQKALKLAEQRQDKRAMTYAKSDFAQLYADKHCYSEAIRLTQTALNYAQYPISYSQGEISDGGDSFISGRFRNQGEQFVSTRFNVYLPSLLDKISEQECRERCLCQDISFAKNEMRNLSIEERIERKKECDESYEGQPRKADKKHFLENCKGNCQLLPPLALQNYHPELLLRLERQLGMLLEKQEQREQAIKAYERAIEHLRVRQETRNLSQFFREVEENTYFELADLLLHQAVKTPAGNKKQAILRDAIDNIESFKSAELRNYFQDECITEFEENAKTVEEFLSSDPNKTTTAIFYPIVLEDRVELLLVFHNGHIEQFKSAISAENFIKNVKRFRKYLQEFLPNNPYAQFEDAKTLHDVLIQPIKARLKQKKIDTLIIISHDLLLTIPFAALYDREGEKYMIKDYALAVAPGWKLTAPRKFQPDETIKALLIGLSAQVDEKFRTTLPKKMQLPLPYVEEELNNLSEIFKRNDRLENNDFSIYNVEKYLTNNTYSIVHFSTHGLFDKNDPNKRFLLAYDGILTMNRLGILIHTTKFREQPIELLNLSACLSAFGNKRSALGLSGMALKTGARSVLGSLWNVTDQVGTRDNKFVVTPAVDIMGWFYKAITKQDGNSSKAKALQEAQKRWLSEHGNSNKGYDSPFFWAPFVVIGNWQ
ncbi:MAG: CHAT domain-containing protein, partial [Candidatus Parabeggiatoa sp.]|nr:CHAT domain-containing protein [Candidatus Parabeggiatoa sp.]